MAGITISKRRNQLKGDVVEALQCLKCMIHHNLIFQEPPPSSKVKATFKDEEVGDGRANISLPELPKGWDNALLDFSDDENDSDV